MTLAAGTSAMHLSDAGPSISLSPLGFESRNVHWGHVWQVGTAHYWVAVTADAAAARPRSQPGRHRLGRDFVEEVAACLLGGYGMPFEVGLAGFHAVRDAGLLAGTPSAAEVAAVLSAPLHVGDRRVRYRFPRQRARYLAGALSRISEVDALPTEARALRDWLLVLPGIGPKTAGWIVRNHLSSDDVAIIDVHIHRAAVRAGVFDPRWQIDRDYRRMEAFFLAWASRGGVHAADLDAMIWAAGAQEVRTRRGAPRYRS